MNPKLDGQRTDANHREHRNTKKESGEIKPRCNIKVTWDVSTPF